MSGKVLVVDDQEPIRELLRRYLEGEGFEVVCCGDPERALELARGGAFDVVLLDNGLPKTMGLAVLPKLVEVSGAAVILMTGFDGDDTRKDALLLGAKGYLTKPLDLPTLAGAVRRAMSRK